METLVHMGLGETVMRMGTNIVALIVIAATILLLQRFYHDAPLPGTTGEAAAASATTPTPFVESNTVQAAQSFSLDGVPRMADLHTIIPNRPRQDVIKYKVQKGDSVIAIAEKFGLKPETLLFSNDILGDNPHNLQPGQEINILPTDGIYRQWQAGEGLNGVAEFYGVTADAIINLPGNHLDPDTIGDYANPNIAPGTWLIIPGGTRSFTWGAPLGVTRDDPAVAKVLGVGSCGKVVGGAVGLGYFIWPANHHYLSGYDYSVETNHRGIDVDGETGDPVYAADAGVIVYAGWNDYGYGYMIMIDHGTGWQTLYAHLSAIYVVCGQSVDMGAVIGAIGSTGRSSGSHLHFELMHTKFGKVNPWDYLP
jgi:murein DD-endopeptidase MepM/ murein hydrolase activator NlpD